ncbi:contactin-associated protein-like 2 isoform B [Alligator mississippiensis]|uniref:Contactin-associated protein-like 2 isoform B n=1 Tax=Alligator mississippiensis TaxID=8496 RepID=A0A151M141_ALLMI|nr:contactin-associated protein-like 2 isoform B [Alligator mississippiensis]
MDAAPKLFSALTLLLVGSWHLGSTASNYNCDDALVSSLPPTAFDSSSEFLNAHSPSFAKLNRRDGAGGWSPLESNQQQWLQIDLGDRLEIAGVATQGRYGSSDWVTSYTLMFSDTGRNWKQYRQEDSIWVFIGNTNADSVVEHKFLHSMKARFLRFIPLKWNPNGRIGLRVEVYGCSYKSDIADFDGRSSLLYRFNQKLMSTFKDVVSLKFKSMQGDGVLFHGEGQRGDYITLELQKGKLSLHINLGDAKLRFSNSHTSVTLGSLLDDQHWHSVLIERFNKQVNFTVDKHTQHFRTKGDSDHLDIDYELSFGGIPVPGKPGTFLKKNFHGCIENLYYNGVNIIDLAKRRKPQIYTVGNVTFSCSEPQIVPITFVSSSSSYLLLPGTPQIDGLSVSFQFRTWNKDGLLLSTMLSEGSGTLLLSLHDGRLMLVIQKASETLVEINEGSNLHDGLWHSVNINARRNRITLMLDNDVASATHATTASPIFSGDSYYFGGCTDNFTDSQCLNPITAFQGCMRLIFIDNQPKDLILVQQGSLGNFSDLHIDLCGIKDRCLPNYCEHGGKCSQSWTTFYCDCSETGYMGATCHNSIYEQSCEGYRHKGKTSGFFHIDSDGSGPLGPLWVYCNITEDKIWTAVQHNNTELNRVHGANPEKPYTMYLSYNGSMEQLEAMINSAEHCEQEAAYYCKKSRLLNTPRQECTLVFTKLVSCSLVFPSPTFHPDGIPFAWWVGRANMKHFYWGGSLPEVQQCACGLEESCLDMRYFCNCDADKEEWANDTGLLSFKDHLPVTQIVITDTNRSDSEAVWRIGPLRCHGDRQFWNAASFNTEASYLLFPPFHAEFSADISFFFKTTAVAGVFLENLGIKDFIRVEINSPKEITFSIDVGNGPTGITVQSPTALNDNQWHYVRAERNLKQTSLQVDNLPKKILDAPAGGNFRLQLNSQLFVGARASRQRGFLGCIRSLHLNGQKLDLEERAKITPGVTPGCPGHCSSYGNLCHNGGKCVEKYNGSSCDCTNSAYEGPFCKEEVSALFEAGTSITYVFQEPYPVTKNASTSSSAIYADAVMPKENIALSFLTAHAPSLLLYINTYFHEYLAVILSKNGSLQVRYRLSKDGLLIFTIDSGNFANREMHHVKINREGKELVIQVDQVLKVKHNFSEIDFRAIKSLSLGKVTDSLGLDSDISKANSYGFIGCLSSVRYNHIAPLKAALRHPSVAPVTVKGTLTESSCRSIIEADVNTVTTVYSSSDPFGKTDEREPLTNAVRSDSAVIGGVIAVVIFIIFCIVAIMSRFLYQHKQTHRSNQAKEKEYPENLDRSFKTDIDLQNTVSECKREYFI